MAENETIRVVGLADLRKALRQIEQTLPRELGAGLAEAAAIVADAARPKVPRRSGAAQASIKVRKKQGAAALAVGGAKAPYYPWLDFGGTVGRGRVAAGNKQRAGGEFGGTAGSVKRKVIRGGRYIYPTLREKDAEVKAKVDEVVVRLAKRAGFETGKG